jgi:hypothetical protein
MVYYLQRENNEAVEMPVGSAITFENQITMSATEPPDFVYHDDGRIDIMRRGTYVVNWYVSQMTGLSNFGQSYVIKKRDYDQDEWVNIAGAAGQFKFSQISGFAIVTVTKEELELHDKVTVALFNNSPDEPSVPTLFTPKMGIFFFGVDLRTLNDRLGDIDQEIINVFSGLEDISHFVHLSEVETISSDTPELAGISVSVIFSGYTYNFWGVGTLSAQQTLTAGQTYMLIDSGQYPPLGFYQGDATIGTLWIETPPPTSNIYYLPIRFGDTGIYFRPPTTYANLPTGTAFKFTQALILVEAEQPYRGE